MNALVAVAPDKFAKGLDGTPEGDADALEVYRVAPLEKALREFYRTDAHLVPYVVEGATTQRRINKAGLATFPGKVVLHSLFADYDNPGHADWTAESRAARRALEAAAPVLATVGIYDTAHGCRYVQPIEPVPAEDAERYLARWLDELEAAGLDPDRACKDWTRHYRLPNVVRDCKKVRSPYLNLAQMRAIALPPLPPVEAPAPRTPVFPASCCSDSEKVKRAAAYVAKVPPAIEGSGGDAHTFQLCARLVRGFDLTDSEALDVLAPWDAGCSPPWGEAALAKKIANARRNGQESIGGLLVDRPLPPRVSTPEVPPPPTDRDAPPCREPGCDDGDDSSASAPHASRPEEREAGSARRREAEACSAGEDFDTIAPSLGSSLDAACEKFRRRYAGEERPLPMPWPRLATQMGGGLWPGAHVLTGTTGSGKTAWAMQCVLHAARDGHPVLYIGLELDTAQIVARLLSLALGESLDGTPQAHWSAIYRGKVTPSMYARAVEALRGLAVHVEEAPPGGWSARAMRARVEALQARYPAKAPLVVLDFLQLVGPSEPGGRREELRERIGAAAYAGREVARKCGACVLMLSSISRAGASELARGAGSLGEGDPADLVGLGKESGDIEFSADTVLCLAREPRPADAAGPGAVWVAVAKQREGPPAWALLSFNGSWLSEVRDPERHKSERRSVADQVREARKDADATATAGRVLELLESGPMSSRDLEAAAGKRAQDLRGVLASLMDSGLIDRGGPRVGGHPQWRLRPSASGCVPSASGTQGSGGVGEWCVPAPIGDALTTTTHGAEAAPENSGRDALTRDAPSEAAPAEDQQ